MAIDMETTRDVACGGEIEVDEAEVHRGSLETAELFRQHRADCVSTAPM